MTERELQLRFIAEDDLSRLAYLACAMLAGGAGALLFKAAFG